MVAVPAWQEKLAKKKAECEAALPDAWRLPQAVIDETRANPTKGVMHVPAACGLLSAEELDITEKYDAVKLIELMAARVLTSYEVTLAFCKRAAIAQQLTNCLTEMFFDLALDRAKAVDEYMEKNGKPMGPFHGLPISVKDLFHVRGTPATIGFVSNIDNGTSEYNSHLIEMLYSQGAVFYVKTNIPQTMMVAETTNNIFGRTLNPHNLNFTAGGSSGGEGALVAMRGSPLSIGTDIGGSVRIPALCNGTLGFKPTAGRIPYGRTVSGGRAGSPGIAPVAGPLANSARDLGYFMENVIKARPWDLDFSARAVPWRSIDDGGPLNVGLLLQSPDIPVSSPIRRSLNEASERLNAAGHTVVPVPDNLIPSFAECTEVCLDMFSLDPRKTGYTHMAKSGEPPAPVVANAFRDWYDRGPKDIHDIFSLNVRRSKLVEAWHTLFRQGGYDVLIMPAHSTPSAPHDTYGIPIYTMVLNLTDNPAATLPYLRVDSSVDHDDPAIPTFKSALYHGLPSHIQIVARPGFDEELARAVELI